MIKDIIELYSTGEIILLSYLFIMNLFAFSIMGIDKYKARKNKWRISEKTFFLLSICGGALGTILGMIVFRHKTQHKSFYMGIPLLYLLNKIIIEIIIVKLMK